MKIARASIDRPLYTWLIILIALFGGIWGFMSLGRLEDPAFTIKNAVIATEYPGATAEQVALEVSEPLESAIQHAESCDSAHNPTDAIAMRSNTRAGDNVTPTITHTKCQACCL